MKLIGMLDSPFVRRVAISMSLLDLPYEHCNWSVGRDLERIRAYSPLGRVPALVLQDGEVLTESGAILDCLDDRVGPMRALLPATGAARRGALQIISVAIGAAEKGRDQIYEQAMRPAGKRHAPWLERIRSQMHGALGVLEARCATPSAYLVEERLTQADITLACVHTFLTDTVLKGETVRYPRLATRTAGLESLAAFRATYTPFFMPGG
jgi:glutathione S-transferase